MNYWLMKSEPDAFSIDDLKRVKVEAWDGVRNYQARNFMRDDMRAGDLAFFYHSSCASPGIVGIMKIHSAARPDPTAFDPKSKYYDARGNPESPIWMLVDVKYVKKLRAQITLRELKSVAALGDMRLLQKGNRLSIMPVRAAHWRVIMKLAGET